MKLRRVQAGVYATKDGRFSIEHQDGSTTCEHPLCADLHRKWIGPKDRGVHWVSYPAWHVWDEQIGDYAGGGGPHEFDTKREAVMYLHEVLGR